MRDNLPVGKLPFELLGSLIEKIPIKDPAVLLGPGIGLDCAVIDVGPSLLILKCDPITFTTQNIGWYAVNVNANDIATTGAEPRWMLVTILLPETGTSGELVKSIFNQIISACSEIGVTLVGGHTEITMGIDRPVISGTMLGIVSREELVTPSGARPDDRILLTKGVPIEGTSILAHEFEEQLTGYISENELAKARNFIKEPGISVLKEARIAAGAGEVHAMHDPTEGGILGALWELSDACQQSIVIDLKKISVPALSEKICKILNIDPLRAISSGALLLAVPPSSSEEISYALLTSNISCIEIGYIPRKKDFIRDGDIGVFSTTKNGLEKISRPDRDELAIHFSK